ncbi:DUF6461 domain-containing protein [Streptomyces sp. NPDC096105]|uniref:DUF6461 domain-containing protein n=1 Tax=Streptomyces sp. NPDC096105 TaxID=3366074 RepID=UPI003813A6DB
MKNSTTGPWAWAEDPRAVMWCVTITYGITPEEVLARYGADARTARLLTRQQAAQLAGDDLPEGSVLRAGRTGDWSFCFEDYGVMGCMSGPLSALSRGTETFSVLRGGDGMNGFAYWRDGQCTERFEPGATGTKPRPPHPWWDAVQGRLDASSEEFPGLVPVLEATARHTRAVLDTGILDGPLLTLRLDDSDLTPAPQTPQQAPRPPKGVRGVPARPGPPPPPTMRQAVNVPVT